jgi:SAM-dependent MidA family methyltransferase
MKTEQENLTSWTFEREMLLIPAKCRKLTNKTSKEKVKQLFEKYNFLISYNKYSKESTERCEKKIYRLEKICNALKRGTINYDYGFLAISEISQVQVTKTNVIVFLKNGKEVSFVSDFEWLSDLF